MSNKFIYHFGIRKKEENSASISLLGSKGYNLLVMSSLELPIPPGFTITTKICNYFHDSNGDYPENFKKQVLRSIKEIELYTELKYGCINNPLLLSARSGGAISMPGMMDTILNLGLNDKIVERLANNTNDQRFAYDCYRRLIQMYGNVVLGIDNVHFENIITRQKNKKNILLDTKLTGEDWLEIVDYFKQKILEISNTSFPQNVFDQLFHSIEAVFKSWNNERAVTYRKINDISDKLGTAVTIQVVKFGNLNEKSASGVAFTRNPSSGDNSVYGEYLLNAQGEDVVAGIRTPQSLTTSLNSRLSLEQVMPEIWQELLVVCQTLERHFRDMQDLEFTVEKGKLWVLQTRTGKRTAEAAVKIAVDMVKEGLISIKEALCRVDPRSLEQLLHPILDRNVKRKVLASGIPASPGVASGKVVFTSDKAVELSKNGDNVILVRNETSANDIHGMKASRGIITVRGGMTSHAAVVARGMGKPCVVGIENIQINEKEKTIIIDNQKIDHLDEITIDGQNGEIFIGVIPTVKSNITDDFITLMQWSSKYKKLKVRANAETIADVKQALKFGAEGVGLCRTEHMFFEPENLILMQKMILAKNKIEREQILNKILPIHKQSFIDLFKMLGGKPITIRLLDPPLNEFLPSASKEITKLADILNITDKELKETITCLKEVNPMLGHRGCRLGISYPEIYRMQVMAIFEAFIATKENPVILEIMIPFVALKKEFDVLLKEIKKIASLLQKRESDHFDYSVGSMIELPSAALNAGDIAQSAEFFSFGTNDLTQMSLGLSRDDLNSFLLSYKQAGIFSSNPFETIYKKEVGKFLSIATKEGKKINPQLIIGLCGEHGGDPDSIEFCNELGIEYVSCSPFRVPIAILAAAQSSIIRGDD